MLVLCACVCLVALVPLDEGYPIGPPVNTIANLCRDMDPNVPSGHGVARQSGTSPFEVVTNQACYKAGQEVQGEDNQDILACTLTIIVRWLFC